MRLSLGAVRLANQRLPDRYDSCTGPLIEGLRDSRFCSYECAGCRVLQAENLEEWIIAVRVLGETVYEGGERFFSFGQWTSFRL